MKSTGIILVLIAAVILAVFIIAIRVKDNTEDDILSNKFRVKDNSEDNIQSDASNIIITSPEIAEIFYELGAADRICGVTRQCDYPAELKEKAKVGDFGKVNIEKVISLQPEAVFTAGLEQEYLSAELSKLDIDVRQIYIKSIAGLLAAIKEISEYLQEEERGELLRKELERYVKESRQNLPEYSPRLYIEIYGNPLMSVADSSYAGELLETAGFDNIFAALPRAYSRVSAEDVVAADPEYIMIMYPGISKAEVSKRKGWERISAVRNGRILGREDFDSNRIVRATPRSVRYLPQLRKMRQKE